MIKLKFKNNEQAIIEDTGHINYWTGINIEHGHTFYFTGIAKNLKGNYAYSRYEMIAKRITEEHGEFYPVICDDLWNFSVVKSKILEIIYE